MEEIIKKVFNEKLKEESIEKIIPEQSSGVLENQVSIFDL